MSKNPNHARSPSCSLAGSTRRSAVHIVAMLIFFLALYSNAGAQWELYKRLPTGRFVCAFLAVTPQGDLLVSTFNASSQPAELPVLLLKDPIGTPDTTILCQNSFEPFRGYSGLAVDREGNFYVSADTGDGASCFIRKFHPDGSPDLSFGSQSYVRSGLRHQGIDVFSNYLVAAVSWGRICIYNKNSGQLIGSTNSPPGLDTVYIRDVVIDPITLNIYGVAQGVIYVWEDGTPANPSDYKMRELYHQDKTSLSAGEGVCFDPWLRAALIARFPPGNQISYATADGKTFISPVVADAVQHHLCDFVSSFDGQWLFVSDTRLPVLYIMRRANPAEIAITAQAAAPQVPPYAAVPPVVPATPELAQAIQWERDYERALLRAHAEKRMFLLYFRSSKAATCTTFEQEVLLKPEFQNVARNLVCAFVDLSAERLLCYRLGVYRTPHVLLTSPEGNPIASFGGRFSSQELLDSLRRIQRLP